MHLFVAAVAFTLGVSFLCSFLEALLLSTTATEVEALKRRNPKRGATWEFLRADLEGTISSILTLNTIANTLGSIMVGALAVKLFGETWLGMVSAVMTFAILIFSEVLPKNLGVVYRVPMQPWVALPLMGLRRLLAPITYLCTVAVRLVIRHKPQNGGSDQEIILLAEKGAKEGTLTRSESSIIANALSLDDVRVGDIMTPRTVVTALNKAWSVGEVFRQFPNLPFGRMPVYQKSLDHVVGLVRRRDLLKAKANDQDHELVGNLMHAVHFIPETVTAAHALQLFLKTHQQLAVVVDEYGAVSGVVTMEDVIEHILGREIFEADDVAVDMRELARAKTQRAARVAARKSHTAATPPVPWPGLGGGATTPPTASVNAPLSKPGSGGTLPAA
jgi:CBS domain containing-hemolysin-like protein